MDNHLLDEMKLKSNKCIFSMFSIQYTKQRVQTIVVVMLFLAITTTTSFLVKFRHIGRGGCQRAYRSFQPFSSSGRTLYAKVQDFNPTMEWKGASHSTSEFVTHVVIPALANTTTVATTTTTTTIFGSNPTIGSIVERVLQEKPNADLSARELVDMGSVWYLPASAPRDPSLGTKPSRVILQQFDQILDEGDYLRVHHHPRRFQAVYDFDWSKRIDCDGGSDKPGVIVDEDEAKGWLVIDKPPRVPVHMTVDNCKENVQACLVAARRNEAEDEDEEDIYVTTPQRLDQNTSGLLVIATSPAFASYFAQLLRNKTSLQLLESNATEDRIRTNEESKVTGGVHKIYKCLVCLQPPATSPCDKPWSAAQAWAELQGLAINGTIVRHYLKPSIRAPKEFVEEPPIDAEDRAAWLESLLRIKKVGPLYTLVGNPKCEQLAMALWASDDELKEVAQQSGLPRRMPSNCMAVTELQIELLTGTYLVAQTNE